MNQAKLQICVVLRGDDRNDVEFFSSPASVLGTKTNKKQPSLMKDAEQVDAAAEETRFVSPTFLLTEMVVFHV